ncbi:hypothetical protein JTB14_015028 [Gonioctena quinquepunctata]|nr:hypothetical protein JTB14_015028 [Gonioctena quinquepunctata]
MVFSSLSSLNLTLENDLFRAEECFSEGNSIDHRNGDIWGNLCLVNLKLNRPHEAEICYQQALHSKLIDIELLKTVQEAFAKYGGS